MDLWGRGRDAERVLGVAGSREAGTSGAGAVPLRSARMTGQKQKQKKINTAMMRMTKENETKRKQKRKSTNQPNMRQPITTTAASSGSHK